MRDFSRITVFLTLFFLLFASAVRAESSTLKFGSFDPDRPGNSTPGGNLPPEVCSLPASFWETWRDWLDDEKNRIFMRRWLINVGLISTPIGSALGPSGFSAWVEETIGRYHADSAALFGTPAYLLSRGILNAHLILNFPGTQHGSGGGKFFPEMTAAKFEKTRQETVESFRALTCGQRIQVASLNLKTPLYLYPEAAGRVRVKVGEEVVFEGRAEKGARIDYNFRINDFAAPKKSFLKKREELPKFLLESAGKIGLNERETGDFENYWWEKLPLAPYYQIGFFDDLTARRLLPLEIRPKPDHDYRVMLYFKPLVWPVSLAAPSNLPKIGGRAGFTSVDFSGVIDY